jgi:solute carrier family 13 (sodium-dependent dicarboxylate transporter), member 2/3/5
MPGLTEDDGSRRLPRAEQCGTLPAARPHQRGGRNRQWRCPMPTETSSDRTAAETPPGSLRQAAGLFMGPAVFLLVIALPLEGLTIEAHRLAAIVSLVVVWWISEAIPIAATALLGAALAVVLGVATAQEALAPFASPTIFLFLGSFILAQAISTHGLDRRVASAVLSQPWVTGGPLRLRIVLGALAAVISMWISNTATAAMLLPMVIGLLGGARRAAAEPRASAGFLLVLAYASSIGGVATPIGTPPNLITIGMLDQLAGRDIDFFRWMALGVPISAAMYAGLTLAARFLQPATPATVTAASRAPAAPPGPWTRGEVNCLAAFAVAVTLWITPGLVALALGQASDAYRLLSVRLDEGIVAILAASLLFVLPVNWQQRKFTITWAEASRIDWGTILLFGGGLSLGRLMFTTGLAEEIGRGLVAASGATSLWTVTAVMAAIAIFTSDLASNTASTSMLVPVALAVSASAGISPIPPALAIAFGASMAFMLPVSTPPNAIVYGTGLVPLTAIVRFGIVLDFVSLAIIVGGLRLLCPVLGLL